MQKEVTSKEYWDNYWGEGKPRYASYDRSRGLWYAVDLLLSDTIKKTRQRLGRKKLKILDCGCGEGLFLQFLAERYDHIEIHGVDYSDAIEKARIMADELGYSFNLRRCDLLDDWDQDFINEFDIVVTLGLIEHFENPQEILRQLTIPLVSGGSLISIIPSFNGVRNFLWRLYDKENYAYHVPINNDALEKYHNDAGLVDVEIYTMGIPTLPGLHNPETSFQRILKNFLGQINGRILHKLYARQSALSKSYPMAPNVACVGYKAMRAKCAGT